MRQQLSPQRRLALGLLLVCGAGTALLLLFPSPASPSASSPSSSRPDFGFSFVRRPTGASISQSSSSLARLDPLAHLSEIARRESWKHSEAGCEVVGLPQGRVGLPEAWEKRRLNGGGRLQFRPSLDGSGAAAVSSSGSSGGEGPDSKNSVFSALRPRISSAQVPTSDARVQGAPRSAGALVRFGVVGDESVGPKSARVLQLAKEYGAEFLLSAGDLAYKKASATEWEQQLNSALGEDFPYYTAIGNHDVGRWAVYSDKLARRAERVRRQHESRDGDFSCVGDLGIASVCAIRGMLIVKTGVGTLCNTSFDHVGYVERALSDPTTQDFRWKVCLLHKNQRTMQRGEKADATGWGIYETCRRHGALIVAGHDHGYARTKLMKHFGEQLTFESSSSPYQLQRGQVEGRTLSILSGLGGKNIRPTTKDGLAKKPWYAASLSEGDKHSLAGAGLVLCNATWNEEPRLSCEFKTVGRAITDRFEVRAAPAVRVGH